MQKIRSEYVVRIEGNIRVRKDPNRKIPTGVVELEADAVTILNAVGSNLPFLPAEDNLQLSEEVRLKHRVLDLRWAAYILHCLPTTALSICRPPSTSNVHTEHPDISQNKLVFTYTLA